MSVVDVCDVGAEVYALDAKMEGIKHKRDLFESALKKITEEEAVLKEKLLNSRKLIAAAEESAAAAAAERKSKGKKDKAAAPPARKLLKKKVPRDTGVLVSLSQFQPLLEQLPLEPRVPPIIDTLSSVRAIEGPGFADSAIKMGNFASGRTITTYPYVGDHSHRQGHPICDRFYVEMSRGRTLMAIADGCNWGDRPLEAATKAIEGFISHASLSLDKITNPRAAGTVLLDSLSTAHNAIIAGKNNVWDAGTTTLLGGIIYPLESSSCSPSPSLQGRSDETSDSSTSSTTTTTTGTATGTTSSGGKEYGLSLLSIGDCKCYLYNHKTRKVREVTRGNRGLSTDASDPGGRLGPYVGNGQPDLRNLSLYFEICQADDIVIMCSDGVHDNLDPAMLGIDPEEVLPEFAGMTWDQACEFNHELGSVARTVFSEKRLELLIGKQLEKAISDEIAIFGEDHIFAPNSRPPIPVSRDNLPACCRPSCPSTLSNLAEDTTSSTSNVFVPTPEQIVSMVTEYCLRVTESSRVFMEEHPHETQPKDLKHFPGKMDHTTCVAVSISFPEDQLTPPPKEVYDLLKIAHDHPHAFSPESSIPTANV